MTRTKQSTEAAVREIRRKTRRKFTPEEMVRIILEGLRGDQSISRLCRSGQEIQRPFLRPVRDLSSISQRNTLAKFLRRTTEAQRLPDLPQFVVPVSKLVHPTVSHSEPAPLVGPAGCSSSQPCEHSAGATPWICAANAAGGKSPSDECGLTWL